MGSDVKKIIQWLDRSYFKFRGRTYSRLKDMTIEAKDEIKKRLLDNALNLDEEEYAESIGIQETKDGFVVKSMRIRASSGERMDVVSRRMEFGTSTIPARPVWKKFKFNRS